MTLGGSSVYNAVMKVAQVAYRAQYNLWDEMKAVVLNLPCFTCGHRTESMDGLPSMEDENCEDDELPPAVLLLLPLGRFMSLQMESRNALSSENCRHESCQTVCKQRPANKPRKLLICFVCNSCATEAVHDCSLLRRQSQRPGH